MRRNWPTRQVSRIKLRSTFRSSVALLPASSVNPTPQTIEAELDMQDSILMELSRRNLLISSAATIAATGVAGQAVAQSPGSQMNHHSKVEFTVNGENHVL